MTTLRLPGLVYSGSVTAQEYGYLESVYSDEFVTRFLAFTGSYTGKGVRYGVVSETDPANHVSTNLLQPLMVSTDPSIPTTFNVTKGLAFTKSGAWIRLDTDVLQTPLAAVADGSVNIVYAGYSLTFANRVVSDVTQELLPTQRLRSTNAIGVATLTDWNNPVLFPNKDDYVVLAVISMVTRSGVVVQSIDMSRVTYGFVRPWFSVVDIEHRSQVGTGKQTTSNPHATGLSDLSSGNLTIYQQSLEKGVVLSKALDAPHTPGQLCTETLYVSNVLTDTSGLITGNVSYGGVGARYIALQYFPVLLGGCWLNSQPQNQIAVQWVNGTNILVFAPNEHLESDLTLLYFHVWAAEPPTSITGNTVGFAQPLVDRELLVADGVAFNQISNPTISFDGSGPIPVEYTVYLNGDKKLYASPYRLYGPIKLNAMGVTSQSVATTMYGQSPLRIGMTRAISGPSLSVVLELVGTNTSNNPISEQVTFDSTWTDTVLPGVENSHQFVTTSNIFKTLTSVRVVTRQNDGQNTVIVIWADIAPYVTPNVTESCVLATVKWDGTSVSTVTDKRNVSYDISKRQHALPFKNDIPATIGLLNSVSLTPVTNQYNGLVFGEDFEIPRSIDCSPTRFKTSTQSKAYVSVNANGFETNNTLTLDGTHALTAKAQVYGYSVSAASPGTNLSAATSPALQIKVDGDTSGFRSVILNPAGLTTGAAIATELQNRIQALGGIYSAVLVDYGVTNASKYTVRSGTWGSHSSVVIAPAILNDCAVTLKLGLPNGGTETLGTSPNTTTGEFTYVLNDNTATAANIVATVNDSTFASSILATSNGSAITMTKTGYGSTYNYPMVVTQSWVATIKVVNFASITAADTLVIGALTVIPLTHWTPALSDANSATVLASYLNGQGFTTSVVGATITVTKHSVTGTLVLSSTSSHYVLTPFVQAAVTYDGFKDGYDTWLPIQLEKITSILSTPPLASGSPSYAVRQKYRSQPVGLTGSLPATKFLVVLYNPFSVGTGSIQARAAFASRPWVWMNWVTATQVSNVTNTWLLTFSENISKIQLEITGSMAGFSVYAIHNNV